MYLVNATDAEKQYKEGSIAGTGLFKTDGISFRMNNGSAVEVGMNQIEFQYDEPLSENGTLECI